MHQQRLFDEMTVEDECFNRMATQLLHRLHELTVYKTTHGIETEEHGFVDVEIETLMVGDVIELINSFRR